MSRFLSSRFSAMIPYNTSGDKSPSDDLIRLNTNENPFEPSPKAIEYAHTASLGLNFYGDPECELLTRKLAEFLNVQSNEIIFGNGSDEILNFIFTGFCENGAIFPDITYSFYAILAEFHGISFKTIPLDENFRIEPSDYFAPNARTIIFANPNAPTGLFLESSEIERIISHNPESLIIIDEAYADFSGKTCVELIHKYENLAVIRTFSKSRSLAGARLGFCVANENLIQDLRTIKNSIAPYNINSMTQAAGIGAIEDEDYTRENVRTILQTREFVREELVKLGFEVLDSNTNFLFTKHARISGQKIYEELLRRKILIRHFSKPARISDFNRITIGTREQMQLMLENLREIIGGAC